MLQSLFLTFFSLLPIIQAHGPDGNHHERRNLATDVIKSCKNPKTFAMTYDDGPYVHQNTISDHLKKQGVLVNRSLTNWFTQGHVIGSHTWSHPNITHLTDAQLNKQLELVEIAMKKILGVTPKFFRPPYGDINERNLKVLKKRGYTVVNWNFDSGDSLGATAPQSKKDYDHTARLFPHPQISLNHETYKTTAKDVTPYAVSILKKAGYRLVSVAECLGLPNTPASFYQTVGKPSKRDSSWTCDGTPVPGAPIV